MREAPVVYSLLILWPLIFLAKLATGDTLPDWLALWPLGLPDAGYLADSRFHPWQIVTYAFLHAGVLQLVLSLSALWLVIGYGVVELMVGVLGISAGTAHFAHPGGLLTGFVLLRGARWLS